MTQDIYLLLGSNVGDRRQHLSKAAGLIAHEVSAISRLSALYETAAWGKTDQAAFLNQAICLQSGLDPLILLDRLKEIERSTGRIHTEKWGPRVIDIDILFYGDQVIQLQQLQVPHPYLPVRRFALMPLAEIAPGLVHPVLQKTIQTLLTECPDHSDVRLYG